MTVQQLSRRQPPITCKPWCVDQDGHPDEFSKDDQTCRSEMRDIGPLSLDGLDTGLTTYARWHGGHGHFNNAPHVVLHIERCGQNFHQDVEMELTADEAADLARELLAVVDALVWREPAAGTNLEGARV